MINKLRFILYAVLITLYIVCIGDDLGRYGAYEGCPLINRYIYIFFHKNIIHVLLNIFSFEMLYVFFKKYAVQHIILIGMILSPYFSFIGTFHEPTVGFSGIVLFMYGFYAYMVNSKKTWINVSIFFIVNYVVFLISKKTNFPLHISSFIFGIIVGFINNMYEKKRKIA